MPAVSPEAHELAQLRQQHEALLRAIAHDLRAPLRHIQSFAPLLTESVQTLAASAPQATEAAADALEFAQHMQQGAQRMALMIEALTELSRAARSPQHTQAVELGALGQALWASLQASEAPARQAQLTLPPAPLWLQADPPALTRILRELLLNACRFVSPQTPPRLQLTAQPLPAGRWRVQLHDNGVGFDPAHVPHAEHLFQPFTRMHRDSEFPGLGCGLALAQTLAQRQGAQLAISAQPGQGCVVTLDWPGASQAAP